MCGVGSCLLRENKLKKQIPNFQDGVEVIVSSDQTSRAVSRRQKKSIDNFSNISKTCGFFSLRGRALVELCNPPCSLESWPPAVKQPRAM